VRAVLLPWGSTTAALVAGCVTASCDVACVCSAWVWGTSVKHQPQKSGKDHCLCDEDVVQLVKR
jgi:ribosome-interacting GTPase 1